MKKVLISTITLLLLALICFALLGKVKIGNWSITGIEQIKVASKNLDTKIADITTLSSITFPSRVSEVSSAAKNMMAAKEEYENKIAFSSEENIQNARQLQNFEMEYLWTIIGNYATKEGVKLQLTVQSESSTTTKSLSFRVTGQYIAITDFIYDIENDDALGFVIENFAMMPDTSNYLVATFMVKDLNINVGSTALQSAEIQPNTEGTGGSSGNLDAVNKVADTVNGINNTLSDQVKSQ